jgi:hypothetical protein
MMKIEIDVWDDRVDYLVKQWILEHQKDNLRKTHHPDDVEYNDRLHEAFELILDYMGE